MAGRRPAARGREGPAGAREPVPYHLQPAGEFGEAAGYDRTRAQAREVAARTVAGIEIRTLRKHFGDLHAVDGVSLSIRDGEFLVLLGSSGSGKTTLLRMIAGLERPTSGEIHIGDQRVDGDVPPRARGIAMVFQSYALYPHRTVFQNIAFPLEASRTPRKQIEEKVRWAAELFSITRYLDRYPRQLSGGAFSARGRICARSVSPCDAWSTWAPIAMCTAPSQGPARPMRRSSPSCRPPSRWSYQKARRTTSRCRVARCATSTPPRD